MNGLRKLLGLKIHRREDVGRGTLTIRSGNVVSVHHIEGWAAACDDGFVVSHAEEVKQRIMNCHTNNGWFDMGRNQWVELDSISVEWLVSPFIVEWDE